MTWPGQTGSGFTAALTPDLDSFQFNGEQSCQRADYPDRSPEILQLERLTLGPKPALTASAKLKREFKRLFTSKPKVLARDKEQLESHSGRYQGQTCFIIGNGPSLTAEDLTLIKGHVSFASNKIYLIYPQTEWRPDFYTVEDALVMSQCYEQIASLEGSQKLMPLQMMSVGKRTKDMTVFPVIHPKSWETPLEDPAFPAFSSDFDEGIAWGSTVVYTQIQLAAAMGFTTICILGLDHFYIEGKSAGAGKLVSEGERNHFHADYRPKGEIWHSPNLDVLERSYARAQDEAKARGIRIVNCSRKTRLGTFERMSLEDVLRGMDQAPPTG